MAAVALRADYDASGLRALAKASKSGGLTRRLLALAAVYDGGSRTDAAKIGDVGLQTVRDWVLRFNAWGPQGSSMARRLGRSRSSMTRTGVRWSR